MHLYVDQFHKEVAIVEQSVSLLLKGLKQISSDVHAGKIVSSASQTASGVTVQLLSESVAVAVSKLSAFLAYLSSNAHSLVEIQSTCANKLNSMRSSSLCSLCSGRASTFLLDGKAIVEEQDCGSFINSCFQSWVMMVNIVEGVRLGQEAATAFSSYGTELFSGFDGDGIKNLRKWLIDSRMAEHIHECGDKGFEGCSSSTNAKICQTTLNLAKPTYLKDILDSFTLMFNVNNSYLKAKKILLWKLSHAESILQKNETAVDQAKQTIERLTLELSILESQKQLRDNFLARNNKLRAAVQGQTNWETEGKNQTQPSHRRRLQKYELGHLDQALYRGFETSKLDPLNAAISGVAIISDTNVVPNIFIPAGHQAVKFGLHFP